MLVRIAVVCYASQSGAILRTYLHANPSHAASGKLLKFDVHEQNQLHSMQLKCIISTWSKRTMSSPLCSRSYATTLSATICLKSALVHMLSNGSLGLGIPGADQAKYICQ